jgi:hypothetical protein
MTRRACSLTLPRRHAIVGGPEPRPARGEWAMNCPRCQHEHPAKSRSCVECGSPFYRLQHRRSQAHLQPAPTDALEQQEATSEIPYRAAG